MSAEGQTFVENHSPYRGTTHAVHLRLGLLSNDAHGYRIFCGDQYLADKCKISLRQVKRAKAQLIKDGYLRLVSPAVGRKVAEYELLFKDEIIGGQIVPLSRIGGQKCQNRGPKVSSSPIYRNKYKKSENDFDSEPLDSEALHENVQRIRDTIRSARVGIVAR